MEILFLILPLALIISIIFLLSFIYSVQTGQFEDLDTPAYRILLEEEYNNTHKFNQSNYKETP